MNDSYYEKEHLVKVLKEKYEEQDARTNWLNSLINDEESAIADIVDAIDDMLDSIEELRDTLVGFTLSAGRTLVREAMEEAFVLESPEVPDEPRE